MLLLTAFFLHPSVNDVVLVLKILLIKLRPQTIKRRQICRVKMRRPIRIEDIARPTVFFFTNFASKIPSGCGNNDETKSIRVNFGGNTLKNSPVG